MLLDEYVNESFDNKYMPHSGKFYSDISNGSNPNRLDWCVIIPSESDDGVVIIKKNTSLVAFSRNAIMSKDYSNPLNSKSFSNTDEAYSKMMKWIGKMVKKDSRGRYFNNKTDRVYAIPENFSDKDLDSISAKVKRI